MKTNFLHRAFKPVMLFHVVLWIFANMVALMFHGKLFPSRLGDPLLLCFGGLSIACIVLYWIKGLSGLYGLLATYASLEILVVVIAVSNLGSLARPSTGLNWTFVAILLTLPIFEVYTLIEEEKESKQVTR